MAERSDPAPDAGRPPTEGGGAIDLGVLENYTAFYLRMAQGASFRTFKKYTGVSKLRPGWFAVLTIINNNPGITPVVLSKASRRDKSTLTPVLRDLLREKLIRRVDMPNDRRSYALHLTPLGVEQLAHLAVAAAAHDRALDAIVGERKPDLLALLRRIETELQ